MLASKDASTPMLPSKKLLLDGAGKLSLEVTTRYRSVVGAIQYWSLTRPDIFLCVNRVCQFISSLTVHWAAVEQILCYLHDTIDMGLCFLGC